MESLEKLVSKLKVEGCGCTTGFCDWSTRVNHNTLVYQYRLCLHNVVVLYRRTIAFSHIVSTNHKSRLHIPSHRHLRAARRHLCAPEDQRGRAPIPAQIGHDKG